MGFAADRHRGARCQLVTWHLNDWRRDALHTRARSASVSGGPRGFFKVRRASGCACGAAQLFWGRRGVIRRGAEGCKPPASGWRVCTGSRGLRAAAPALGTLAPGGGGLGAAGAGLDALWEAFAGRGRRHPWRLNCPILTGALRVDARRSARLLQGAARVWVCQRRGAAVSGSARRQSARPAPRPPRRRGR